MSFPCFPPFNYWFSGGELALDQLPIFDKYDFTAGLPSGFSHSRGTSAYLQDSDGVWRQRSGSDPLIGPNGLHVIPAISQVVSNSALTGASIGIVGSGGSLPTGWVIRNSASFTWTVTALPIVNGLQGVTLNCSGTLASGSNIKPCINDGGQIVSAIGDLQIARCIIKADPTCGGGQEGFLRVGTSSVESGAWTAAAGTAQDLAYLNNASTTHNRTFICFFNVKNTGDSINNTFTIFAPQMYKQPQAASALFIGGSAQSSNAEVVSWGSVPPVPFTIVFDVYPCVLSGSATQALAEFCTDANNYLRITRDGSRLIHAEMVIGGVSKQVLSPTKVVYDNAKTKIGLSIRSDGFSISVNGQDALSSTSSMAVPSFASMLVGKTQDDTAFWWGWIESMNIALTSVSDAALAASTYIGMSSGMLKGVNFSGAEFSPATEPGTIGTTFVYPRKANYGDFNYIINKGGF